MILAKTREGRLNQLKAFLREHAKQFNMSDWFTGKGEYEIREKIRAGRTRGLLSNFEACGTTCCIGGASALMLGKKSVGLDYEAAAHEMGVDRSDMTCYAFKWPEGLYKEYKSAIDKEDFEGAVEAGIKAIDYYNDYHRRTKKHAPLSTAVG